MSFTDVGNKPPKAAKSKDGAFPTKHAGSVKKQTGKAGFPTANQGNAPPRASRGKDGNSAHLNDLNEPDMADGAKPAHGKSFEAKFNVSAMSQAMKGRMNNRALRGNGAA